ncbi:MAG: cytochrome P460 family protein [Candidatus Acidiferrales bacterium]
MPLLGSPKVCAATWKCLPADAVHVRVGARKGGKRFADSGGWGYALFDFDNASNTFKPGTLADHPANDAKCGFTWHTIVKTRGYVFTDYGRRGA